MKTISTLLAALATAAALFAAPAVQAADNQERVNPHAVLPYPGSVVSQRFHEGWS